MLVRKWGIALVAVLAASLILAQTVPVRITNPPSGGELTAPPEIEAILNRSCADCHSNHTRWPWYTRIAPVSWMVAHDVELGRRQINFSDWGNYYPVTRKRKLQWMLRSLHQETMPPRSYRLMHRQAGISETDRAQLERWIESELGQNEPSAR